MTTPINHLTTTQALELLKQSGELDTEVFKHGTLSVEYYKPEKIDKQTFHTRDEIYVIATGSGDFYMNGETVKIKPGDFLFAPAYVEHRFHNFTDDFATWVFFYGPEGGEQL